MKNFNILLLCLLVELLTVSSGICGITSIEPEIVVSGEVVTINGNSFASAPKVEILADNTTIVLKVEDSSANKITFKAPTLESSAKCTVKVDGTAFGKQLAIYSNSYIKEAVVWKKNGMSDSAILEHISKMALDEIENSQEKDKQNKPAVFNGVRIIGASLAQLKEANFSEDFIVKLEGQPQRVTLGMAAIFLPESGKVTTAPILRIFLTPKSYYEPRYPLSQLATNNWWTALRRSIDLNIGYTVVSTKTGSEQIDTNFLLGGLSFELNRAALLNIGAAIPTGSINDKSTKFYAGITVDQNFLKAIGLME